MLSSRTGPPLRVVPHGLFSWLPLCSSPLLLFSLQVPPFLPAYRGTTSSFACLGLRGHDSRSLPSRCAIRGLLGRQENQKYDPELLYPRDAQRAALLAEVASQGRSILSLFSGKRSELPLPYGNTRGMEDALMLLH